RTFAATTRCSPWYLRRANAGPKPRRSVRDGAFGRVHRMKRFHRTPLTAALAGCALFSCTGAEPMGGSGASTNVTTIGSDDDGDDDGKEPNEDESEGGDDSGPRIRLDAGDSSQTCFTGDLECPNKIDLLFVIDNSGTMAVEQENLARNFPLLIRKLENLTDR